MGTGDPFAARLWGFNLFQGIKGFFAEQIHKNAQPVLPFRMNWTGIMGQGGWMGIDLQFFHGG